MVTHSPSKRANRLRVPDRGPTSSERGGAWPNTRDLGSRTTQVQILPLRPIFHRVAQLAERLLREQEAGRSSRPTVTNMRDLRANDRRADQGLAFLIAVEAYRVRCAERLFDLLVGRPVGAREAHGDLIGAPEWFIEHLRVVDRQPGRVRHPRRELQDDGDLREHRTLATLGAVLRAVVA